jgi:hypothetical protein
MEVFDVWEKKRINGSEGFVLRTKKKCDFVAEPG